MIITHMYVAHTENWLNLQNICENLALQSSPHHSHLIQLKYSLSCALAAINLHTKEIIN
jgi:hypothetical protein